MQDEEQGQAQARNEAERDNPDEGASSDEDGAFVPHRLKCISYSHVTTFKIPFASYHKDFVKKDMNCSHSPQKMT